MDIKFNPLTENDFSSQEAFSAFQAAKGKFIRNNSDDRFADILRSKSDLEEVPVLQIINAEENKSIRARMVGELIQDDKILAKTKMLLAKEYLFPKLGDAGSTPPSNVPSVETYIILLKSKKDAHATHIPSQLESRDLNTQVAADMPHLSIEDQKEIRELEEKYKTKGTFSEVSQSVLEDQLIMRLNNARRIVDVNQISSEIFAFADLSDNPVDLVYKIGRSQESLPRTWTKEEEEIDAAKREVHKNSTRHVFAHYLKPPAGENIAEQQENLSRNIRKLNSVIANSGNYADSFIFTPADLVGALKTLKSYESQLGIVSDPNFWEFGKIVENLQVITEKAINNNKCSPSEGVDALMTARLAHTFDNSLKTNVYTSVNNILKKSSDEEAVKICQIYLNKSPALVAKNMNERNGWTLTMDASERAQKKDIKPEIRSQLMDAIIDLNQLKENGQKPSINYTVTQVLRNANVSTEEKKLFVGKMLNKGFPELPSSELNEIINITKETKDVELQNGMYMLGVKAHLNNIKDDPKKDHTLWSLVHLYSEAAGTGDHANIRTMIREHGGAIGLPNEQVGEVLKSIRANYRKREGKIERGIRTVHSWLKSTADITGLLQKGKAPSNEQKLTA